MKWRLILTMKALTYVRTQERVREELVRVFGDSDRPCNLDDAAQLKFLECCIKESLRLYPPVPNIKRYIHEDIELESYKIPAGSTISMHIYALHRNDEIFSDPLTFNPERFSNEQSNGRHPFAFVPFSAGPRNCIGKETGKLALLIFLTYFIPNSSGQRFAMFEEKVVLSSLLRRYRVTYNMAKHGPPKPCADLVLKPHHGMPLILTPLTN